MIYLFIFSLDYIVHGDQKTKWLISQLNSDKTEILNSFPPNLVSKVMGGLDVDVHDLQIAHLIIVNIPALKYMP